MLPLLQKTVRWTVGVMFAIAMVGSLSVLTAPSLGAATCPYDGVTFLGEQGSSCYLACYAVHGETLQDYQVSGAGCCRCFF
jgi:hypothetical protein